MNINSKKEHNFKAFFIIILLLFSFGYLLVGHSFDLSGLQVKKINSDTKVFVDDLGRTVTLPKHPKQIVSIITTYDTILLGLVEAERLAAVSRLSQYEDYSFEYEKARKVKQSVITYSLEMLVKMKVDLVIVPEYIDKTIVVALEDMGIPVVYVQNSRNVEETKDTIAKLAYLVDEDEKGQAMIKTLEKDIQTAQNMVARIPEENRKRILCISSMDGYAGTGSYFSDMCHYMNVHNAPEYLGYPPRTAFTEERIVKMNPDFILVPIYKEKDKLWLTQYGENPALASTTAVKNNQVTPIKAAYLYTSNQYVGKTMQALIKIIYPEYVK